MLKAWQGTHTGKCNKAMSALMSLWTHSNDNTEKDVLTPACRAGARVRGRGLEWTGFQQEKLSELNRKGVQDLTCIERMGTGKDMPSKRKYRSEALPTSV